MLTFKVTTVGASEGFILNKEARLRLNVQKGDTLFLTQAPGAALRITPYDPDIERQAFDSDALGVCRPRHAASPARRIVRSAR